MIQNVVGGIGDSLKFGARMLKDTVGKAVPISKLEKEYFALKNGVLYWYQNERARKAKGQIIVRNIDALEVNPKNKLEITLLYQKKVYKLQSLDTIWQAQKWFNSLKMVKELGDIHNLDPDRYMKLNVYSRENARIVFRDFEILLTAYETKICKKIFAYKYTKIFDHDDAEDTSRNANRKSTLRAKSLAAAEQQSSVQDPARKQQPSEPEDDQSYSDSEELRPKGKLGRLKAFYLNKKKEMKVKKDKKQATQRSEPAVTDATTVDSSVKNNTQYDNIAQLQKQ